MADVTLAKDLIDRFCRLLARMDGVEVSVTDWPEDGGKGGWDADVDRGGVATAVELTVLNHVEGERLHAAVWKELADGLESAVNGAIPGRGGWVSLAFELPPMKKKERRERGESLRADIIEAIAGIDDDIGHQVERVGSRSELPFTLEVWRHGRGFHVAYCAPNGHLDQLARDIERALSAKTHTLAAAKGTELATLLLLHGENPFIAADTDFLDAFRAVATRHEDGETEDGKEGGGKGAAWAFDDVFLVRTSTLFRVLPLQLRGATVLPGELDRWNLQQMARGWQA